MNEKPQTVETLMRECHVALTPPDVTLDPSHDVTDNGDNCACSQCEQVHELLMETMREIAPHLGGAYETMLSAVDTMNEVMNQINKMGGEGDPLTVPFAGDSGDWEDVALHTGEADLLATAIEETPMPNETPQDRAHSSLMLTLAEYLKTSARVTRLCLKLFVEVGELGLTVQPDGVGADVHGGDGLLDLHEKRAALALCLKAFATIRVYSTEQQVKEVENESSWVAEEFEKLIGNSYFTGGELK